MLEEELKCFNCPAVDGEGDTQIVYDEQLDELVCTICLPEFKEWSYRP